jgi:SAM-dependent methyltransferase
MNSPAFLPGAFQVALGAIQAKDQLEECFKTGKGMGWHEHHANVFVGTERFFRPGYAANLISAWIPSLEGVDAKLQAGARVADVGCGLGASTILMAKNYPKSEFVGFDYHDKSIETAKQRAKDAGVAGRIIFEVAMAKNYPGRDYDFVTFFDCLHDMGDPAGASTHVHSSLRKDGTWMIVEPFAGDKIEENPTQSGGHSMVRRRCCVRRPRYRRRWERHWVRKRGKSGCAKWSLRVGLRVYAARHRRHSIWYLKHGHEHWLLRILFVLGYAFQNRDLVLNFEPLRTHTGENVAAQFYR